jgi:hypothetical protein
VLYKNGTDWRKLAGTVREISVNRDGEASLRFDDGESMPVSDGSELLIPDDQSPGVRVQIKLRTQVGSDRDATSKRKETSE